MDAPELAGAPHRGRTIVRLARHCLHWARRRTSGADTDRMLRLAELRGIEQATQQALVGEVADSRDAGHSWHAIGAALGMSRQSAHRRFARRHRRRPDGDAEPACGAAGQ